MSQIPAGLISALSKLNKVPGYIKQAAYCGPRERDSLPPLAFADAQRRYPAFDKSSIYLSALTGHLQGGLPAKTARELRKRAAVFGVEQDLDDLQKSLDAVNLKEAGVRKYALDYQDDRGARVRLFPCATPEEIVKSAAELYERRSLLPWEMRHKAARELLRKAADEMLDLPRYIHQAAGENPAPLANVVNEFTKRAVYAKGPHSKRYADLCSQAYFQAPKPTLPLEKVAGLLDLADRLSGLHVKYATHALPTPEEVLFQGPRPQIWTIKVAGLKAPVAELRRSSLTIDDFAELGRDFQDKAAALRTGLPRSSAQRSSGVDWAKFAVAAEALPAADQRRLARIIRSKWKS